MRANRAWRTRGIANTRQTEGREGTRPEGLRRYPRQWIQTGEEGIPKIRGKGVHKGPIKSTAPVDLGARSLIEPRQRGQQCAANQREGGRLADDGGGSQRGEAQKSSDKNTRPTLWPLRAAATGSLAHQQCVRQARGQVHRRDADVASPVLFEQKQNQAANQGKRQTYATTRQEDTKSSRLAGKLDCCPVERERRVGGQAEMQKCRKMQHRRKAAARQHAQKQQPSHNRAERSEKCVLRTSMQRPRR